MPFAARKGHGCPESRPWAIVNTDTGERRGCSETQTNAAASARAANAASKDIEKRHALVWIGFDVARGEAEALAIPGGMPPERMHATVIVLGPVEGFTDEEKDLLAALVTLVADAHDPFDVTLTHATILDNGDPDEWPIVIHLASPELTSIRGDLVEVLSVEFPSAVGFSDHGFLPHITLTEAKAGSQPGLITPRLETVRFDALSLRFGDDETRVFALGIPMGQTEDER